MNPWKLCDHGTLQVFQPMAIPGQRPGELTILFPRACTTCGKCDVCLANPPEAPDIIPARALVMANGGRA